MIYSLNFMKEKERKRDRDREVQFFRLLSFKFLANIRASKCFSFFFSLKKYKY